MRCKPYQRPPQPRGDWLLRLLFFHYFDGYLGYLSRSAREMGLHGARETCMKRSCPSGRFDSGKPHGKFNAVDLVEDGGVRFVTPRFLRPPSPAKSGVRPWRRWKLVRKIFALPPSVALHDSDAAKVLHYEAFQRSKVDPDQLTSTS
jgi:hypothetical protein